MHYLSRLPDQLHDTALAGQPRLICVSDRVSRRGRRFCESAQPCHAPYRRARLTAQARPVPSPLEWSRLAEPVGKSTHRMLTVRQKNDFDTHVALRTQMEACFS